MAGKTSLVASPLVLLDMVSSDSPFLLFSFFPLFFPPFKIIHSLTNPFILWLIHTYALSGRVRFTGPLDSWPLFVFKSIGVFLFLDFCFYFQHRFCHAVPAVYQYVHKQHHRFKVSCGVAFEYAHPLEGLFFSSFLAACSPYFFFWIRFPRQRSASVCWVLLCSISHSAIGDFLLFENH